MKNKVIIIGGVAVLVSVGLWAYLKGKNSDGGAESENTVNDAEKEVKKLDLTYPNSWYSSTADGLEPKFLDLYKLEWTKVPSLYSEGQTALNYIREKIIALKTKSDWLKLVAEFDRRYNMQIQLTEKSNLIQWINHFTKGVRYIEKDLIPTPMTVELLFIIRIWLDKKIGVSL